MLEIGIESKLLIKNVEDSIEEVCSDFRDHPSHFFTENDLVCRFYLAFNTRQGNIYVKDASGYRHSIIHTEYPTPFRVDMHGSYFETKGEDDRTPLGKKYRRGHYDVAILNPLLIKQLPLVDIRFQNFALFRSNVLPRINSDNPMITYGLEFLYERGEMTKNGASNFIDKIYQDHKKLVESTHLKGLNNVGFLFKHKTIAFFEDSKYKSYILEAFRNNENVKLVVPNI
jgi:hypothetical protein